MRNLFALMFLSLLLLQACVKETFNSNQISDKILISPTFAAPLAYANFTLAKVISSDTTASLFLQTDNDNLIHLIFHTDLDKFTVKDLVGEILQQDTFSNFLGLTDFSTTDFNAKLDIHCSKTVNYEFDMEDDAQRVDSVKIRTFKLNVTSTSTFPFTGTVKVTFPSILSADKVPYSMTIQHNNDSVKNTEIDLSNFTINLQKIGIVDNIMPIEYTLDMKWSGTNVTNNDYVKITVIADEIDASALYGDLGQVTKTINPSTIDLSYNTKILDGNIWFANPKLDLSLKNSFGVPLKLTNDGIVLSFKNKPPVTLTGVPETIMIASPLVQNIGSEIVSHIFLDENSNLSSLIGSWPTSISFGGTVLSNPNPGIYNFVTDTSYFQTSIDLDVPMNLEAQINLFCDTTSINIASLTEDDADKVKLAKFYVSLENGFPVSAKAQIYFTDENYQTIDSLFVPATTVDPAPLGNDGKASGTVMTTKIEEITSTKLKNVLNSKYMILKMSFVTTGANPLGPVHSPVKIYANYKFGMKVSAAVATDLSN